ncbi:MAG: alpha/beta hydrolase [Lachnospiraceae bacterium]|nr:alpha/beta hydrolase [Lachnospiraceae bacterium]
MKEVIKIALSATAIVAALTAAAGFAGYNMMNGFLRRHGTYDDDAPADKSYTSPEYYQRYLDEVAFNEGIQAEDWTIRSKDGLKLYASFVPAKGEAVRNIILCHGYHSSSRKDFGGILHYYYKLNCNLLLIEERAHRRSEGKYLTMGIRESEDIALWAHEMERRLGGSLPMYLHGMSMGAASVLMAQGEDLPKSLVGIIADCGFTTPMAIARAVMRKGMGPMTHIALPLVDIWARIKAGSSMSGKSATEILRKANVPTLFIHGTGDAFVPPHMTIKNYQACAAPKRICLVDGASHAMSWYYDTDKYKAALEGFFADLEAAR